MDCDSTQQAQPVGTGTDRFTSRSNDVFAGLGELEKKHTAFLKVLSTKGSMEDQGLTKLDPDEEDKEESHQTKHLKKRSQLGDTTDSDYTRQVSKQSRGEGKRHSTSKNFGSSSGDNTFKCPQRRPFHKYGKQSLPDFKKHPEKYTHYSLGDISEKDKSERSNSQAAFAFLEERRLQREKEEKAAAGVLDEEDVTFDTELAACSQGQIAFSRPHQKRNINSVHQDKEENLPSLGSTKSPLLSSFDDDNSLEVEEKTFGVGDARPRTSIKDFSESSNENNSITPQTESSFKSRKTKVGQRKHIRKKNIDNKDDSD